MVKTDKHVWVVRSTEGLARAIDQIRVYREDFAEAYAEAHEGRAPDERAYPEETVVLSPDSDAELMRLGRFDEKFFFLPTPDECRAIATLHLAKHACMLADVDGRALADGDALAGALEGDAYRARIERAGEDARSLADDAPVGRRRAWLPRGLRGHARQGDPRRRRYGPRALDVRHAAGVIGVKQVN